MTLQPDEITTLQRALSQLDGLQLAYVFGSIAKGTASPSSDIDLAVLANHPLTAAEKIALTKAVAEVTGRPVDLIDLRTAGHPVLGEVLRDGRRLLGSAQTHADLSTRAVLDASDFLPYVQRMLKQRRQAWIG